MPRPPVAADEETTKTSTRSLSACEIARNVKYFNAWCQHHDYDEVDFSDIPNNIGKSVRRVFNLTRISIPLKWLDRDDNSVLPDEFYTFLRDAHQAAPELFSCETFPSTNGILLTEIICVFVAWTRLMAMRSNGVKYSESDFAANVYNVFRSPAVRHSLFKTQCSVSLAKPFRPPQTPIARKSMVAKTAVPDGAVFIQPSALRHLSSSAKSPWKTLNAHARVSPSRRKHLSPSSTMSFKSSKLKLEVPSSSSLSRITSTAFQYQSTPCTQAPETPSFEFASSFWEDKKSAHEQIEHAIRQNRISTASAVRQLHSFRVRAPIFGLVWAKGRVRAHVDWWEEDEGDDHPRLFSAMYCSPDGSRNGWDLKQPADILRVFALVRNIDIWTQHGFRKKVEKGIRELLSFVVDCGGKYTPWRWTDMRMLSVVHDDKENREAQIPRKVPKK